MKQPTGQRLVVFGCSLTKDNLIDTWADLLAKDLNIELVNYAERGAGYDYIVQKALSADIRRNDIIVIMWPSADRYDLYVNSATPHLQKDVLHASWLDGCSPAFVDYNGNYNQTSGWFINGAVPRGYKHYYYKYFYNQTTHVNKSWSLIVLLQHYLNTLDVRYLMCNSYPVSNPIQYHDDGVDDFNYSLYDKIDFNKFVNDADKIGFIQLVQNKGFTFFNPHYPNTDSHQWYIENYIKPKIFNVY